MGLWKAGVPSVSTAETISLLWPVPEGEPGRLVATSLFSNNAAPFLRWDSGDIVVYKSEMTFERPARGLLTVQAYIKPEDFSACLERLQAGDSGRIRMDIHVDLFHDEVRCASMHGLYVVWLK